MKYHLILKTSVLYIGLFLLRVIFTLLLLQIVSLCLEFAQTQLSFERNNLRHGRSPSPKSARWQRGWNGWKENWGDYFSVYGITKYLFVLQTSGRKWPRTHMGPTLTVRWPSCHSVTPYGNVRSRASLWGPPAIAGSMSRAAVSVLETPALATDSTGRIASILCFRGFLWNDKKHDFYFFFFS